MEPASCRNNHRSVLIRITKIQNTLLCIVIFFLLAIVFTPHAILAQSTTENKALGFNIAAGLSDVWHVSGTEDGKTVRWQPGLIASGGFFSETMFTPNFGMHSGLHYAFFKNELQFGSSSEATIVSKSQSMIIPLYLLSSLGSKVKLDILYGIAYMHIFHNSMSNDGQSTNGIKYLNYNQFGGGLQLRVRFAINKFTHFYFGPHAQFYLSNLIESTNWRDYMYNTQCEIGMLFTTF